LSGFLFCVSFNQRLANLIFLFCKKRVAWVVSMDSCGCGRSPEVEKQRVSAVQDSEQDEREKGVVDGKFTKVIFESFFFFSKKGYTCSEQFDGVVFFAAFCLRGTV
jgi:hypothetical protein